MTPEELIDSTEQKPSKKPQLVVVLILAAVLLIALAGARYNAKQHGGSPSVVAPVSTTQPARTEFGTKLPTDFPTNIPVEKGAVVNQSYSLDYKGEKLLTIVFPSAKTIKQNYTLYTDFLKNDHWTITNKYESATVSSLYGTKDQNEINVTINTAAPSTTAKSEVSISVLKK